MDLDLSAYKLYLMPIGFLTTANYATGLAVSNDERNLVNYLANLIKESHTDQGKDFNVSLDVNISFKRNSVADAATAPMPLKSHYRKRISGKSTRGMPKNSESA